MIKKLIFPFCGLLLCISLLLMACSRQLSMSMNSRHSIRSATLTPASYVQAQEPPPCNVQQ